MTQTTDASLAELLQRISADTSRLVRDEVALAKAEMSEKGKRAGVGGGLFGGAALFALYGLGALITAAILALAGPLPAWGSALVVALVLFGLAAAAAILGKGSLSRALPPAPEEALAGVKLDLDAIKPGDHR